MSQKKMIFMAIAGLILVAIVVGMMLLSGKKADTKTPKGPKDITVWVVGDESAGFEEVISGFKKNPTYKETQVVVSKFATYKDYEGALINVIADGNSPDIFVVPSTGAALLESKIELIPSSRFDQDDLSRNLPKLFDPLVKVTPGKNSEGKTIDFTFLKGIPLGYETMGIYYNRAALSDTVVPATWEEFDTTFKTPTSSVTPPALWLSGQYIQGAASVASLFLVQKWVTSLSSAANSGGAKALEAYTSFGQSSTSPDSIVANIPEMDQKQINTTDLFARGKVSMIFGFPSTIREIEYSLKRAASDVDLERRDVRSASVPQYSTGKKYNLARYNYFAVSKSAPEKEAATDFISYLSTKEAGLSYANAFPQYLPARKDVLDIRREERTLSKGFQWIVYDSFIPASDVELINFDRELTSEFEESFGAALVADRSPDAILTQVRKQVDCRKKQLIELSGYEVDCSE